MMLLLALQGYFFGIMFGVLFKEQETAITMLTLILIPMIIFAGLVVNINDIPVYINWMHYASPLFYAFSIVFQDLMTSSKFIHLQSYDLPSQLGIKT